MDKDALRLAVTNHGSHFFDRATMRFFSSRLCMVLPRCTGGAVWFVTSEQGPYGPRLYTVRRWNGADSVDTIGGFQAYRTRGAAITAAKAARKREEGSI
jgi:hypothetical protein